MARDVYQSPLVRKPKRQGVGLSFSGKRTQSGAPTQRQNKLSKMQEEVKKFAGPDRSGAVPIDHPFFKKLTGLTPTRTKSQYQLPSVIKGVPHRVEGFETPTKIDYGFEGSKKSRWYGSKGKESIRLGPGITMGPSGDDKRRGINTSIERYADQSIKTAQELFKMREAKSQAKYDQTLMEYKEMQKARKRIRTIPDLKAGEAERERRARLRRFRGRLGTMLSDPEVLG